MWLTTTTLPCCSANSLAWPSRKRPHCPGEHRWPCQHLVVPMYTVVPGVCRYIQAAQLLDASAASTSTLTFPSVEVEYLASTAWNCGAYFLQLNMPELAEQFMATAFRLIKHVSDTCGCFCVAVACALSSCNCGWCSRAVHWWRTHAPCTPGPVFQGTRERADAQVSHLPPSSAQVKSRQRPRAAQGWGDHQRR